MLELLLSVTLLLLPLDHSPAPGLFLLVLPPPPSEKEAAGSLLQSRFETRVSTTSSGKEVAPHLLPAHFGPRGFTSSGGRPTWNRSPPDTIGHEVGCRSFDTGIGAQCPADGWRKRLKFYGGDRLPLAIPSVGGSQGRPLGAGQEHR